ncbi:MAG: ArsR/SmtB family transcription factor [Candidatus Thorarchaeota archaeon]
METVERRHRHSSHSETDKTSDVLHLQGKITDGASCMTGDSGMDSLKILTGEEAIAAFKALADENRRRILHALKARRMSTSEIVEFLSRKDPDKEIKPQTVRYHLKELERAGLIRQDGYEPAGNGDTHIMQKLWRATAESIFIATEHLTDIPERRAADIAMAYNIVSVMKQLGFAIPEEPQLKELTEQYVEWDKLWRKGRRHAESTLRSVPILDPEVYIALRRLLSVIHLHNEDYERYWTISRRVTDQIREAYRKGAGKNPEVY